MALGGKFPILLVGLTDVLSASETMLLSRLSAISYPESKEAQQAKAKNDAEIARLKAKAVIASEISDVNFARLPIVLDGTVIPAEMSNYSTLMVKQLSVFEGTNVTNQAANTVSIDIKTSRSADTSIFIDLLFSVADIIFSRSDVAPSVSFFGGSIAIPNGWLVRMSRRGNSANTEEVITLEIAKDLTFLFGRELEYSPVKPEKTVDIIEPSGNWQVGGVM